ncbi:hypothetical protein [Agromyces kandeliae]|uniref:DUF559 domain-containing protein n=1 Tax=Agromyces kandeliae TaxID=2666141 RepID=A0A6L5R286_9MICO|nr:hypothetical protein [Agromyces kandeliae]MRX44032.1 hypothetical protein [Agromyces kandeliae]
MEHTFVERCRTVLAVLDARVFATGTTAAILHGLPVPPTFREALEFGIPAPHRAVRRTGVTARSLRIDEVELTAVSGIRTTTLPRTWCELARTLDVPELVAAGDVALRRVGFDALARASLRHPDRRMFEEFGEVLEYQGDHHRTDLRQWRRDRTRESDIEALGYHVTEVTQADLDEPEAMVRRLRTTLRRRGWTADPIPSRWFPVR